MQVYCEVEDLDKWLQRYNLDHEDVLQQSILDRLSDE